MVKNLKITQFKKILGTWQGGFTLIEVVVSIGIFLMISYLVLSVTMTSRASSSVASALIFINSQARLAALNISSELMQAQVSSVRLEDQIGACPPTCPATFRRIRFMVPLVDANGNIIYTPGGDIAYGDGQTTANSIRYVLSGTNLVRQILDAGLTVRSQKIIAQNIAQDVSNSGFTVQFDATSTGYIVNITFSISRYQGTLLAPPITFNISIAATPRN